MKLKEALDAKKNDIRLRDRFLSDKLLSQSDIDAHLESLPEEDESGYTFRDPLESMD